MSCVFIDAAITFIVAMNCRMFNQPDVDDQPSNVRIITLLASKSPVISVVVRTESCIIPVYQCLFPG